jgi:predicted esterase
MVTIAADKLQVGDGALLASAGKLNGIPMLIFYGLSDQLCMPAEALALKAKLGGQRDARSAPRRARH